MKRAVDVNRIIDNNELSCVHWNGYKALYGRNNRYPLGWEEVGKRGILGPDLS